ncbi:PIN domain-containing protein [Chamaesiphon sp. OTE_8_metabat_110]|uniref:type II toxin-antitoxin system VapC family toxin n=1 Tax=Chamaesiphon sp. OTE_8_metabat_110 TaxID=2964696 RepID=UPI00286D1068|nr:PIN domain-containing protein [Chamaesiphon sp. OTE_8_metabat_110]
MQYIVDTHALIWFLEGNPRLGNAAKQILENSESKLVLPAIALAEASFIVERGKTSIPSVNDLHTAVNGDPRVVVYPLDRAIIEITNTLLSINEMHDRQIVATAIILKNQGKQVSILTCDRNITMSGVVPIIW